jgi:hypothetical protein
MSKLVRRALTTGVATVAAVALMAGQANAHFCFKEEQNARSAEGKGGSAGWFTFAELALQETGLCPAGIEVLADAAGVTPSTTIHAHAVMAGGTLKKESGGNKAIGHLDIDAIIAAIPDGVAACAP